MTEAHVWKIDLDRAPLDESALDDEERRRAAAFRFEDLRRRYVAAHTALHAILSRYTTAPLRIARAAHGKPYLVDSPLRFSLSHSGDLALVAVAREVDLGVDVERIAPNRDVIALARRFFPPDEAAAVVRDPSAFYRLWTRREAYLKATGLGIQGLGFPIPPDYFLADLDLAPAYAAALACPEPARVGWRSL